MCVQNGPSLLEAKSSVSTAAAAHSLVSRPPVQAGPAPALRSGPVASVSQLQSQSPAPKASDDIAYEHIPLKSTSASFLEAQAKTRSHVEAASLAESEFEGYDYQRFWSILDLAT